MIGCRGGMFFIEKPLGERSGLVGSLRIVFHFRRHDLIARKHFHRPVEGLEPLAFFVTSKAAFEQFEARLTLSASSTLSLFVYSPALVRSRRANHVWNPVFGSYWTSTATTCSVGSTSIHWSKTWKGAGVALNPP